MVRKDCYFALGAVEERFRESDQLAVGPRAQKSKAVAQAY